MVSTSALLARLGAMDSCSVADGLDSLGLKGATFGITPAWPCGRIVGVAQTMKIKPVGRETSTRHLGVASIDRSDGESIIVIEGGGRNDISCWGGLLSLAASRKGIRGVIVDGACRDIDDANDLAFPVYSRGAVPMTARGRIMEASTNEEITITGVIVRPGDLLIADRSGVVFIPSDVAEKVIEAAEGFAAKERAMAQALRDGGDVVSVLGGPGYERMLEKSKA